ncbi:hypothetical protein D0Z03_000020 [Geotrichum reessii]|nr:hypothetical protein D0Z03_000020 [Galactomyces reessii]
MKLSTAITATAIATASFAAAQDHGEEYAQTMGPVAFLWPPDREWSEDAENTAPCGTTAGPMTNRSQFPLDGGHIALVAQDDAWAVNVRISFKSNPTSLNDFQDWFASNITQELEEAHMCYRTPSVPSSIKSGDFGTIQLEYNAIDGSNNVSHFACADVYFVEKSKFQNNGFSAMCFNTSDGEIAPDSTPSENEVAAKGVNSVSTSKTATPAGAATSAVSTSANGAAAPALALGGFAGIAGFIAALI